MPGQMKRGEDIEHYADKQREREAVEAEALTNIDVDSQDGNWIRGTITVGGAEFDFNAKMYPQANPALGITECGADGHISKLRVTNDNNGLAVKMNYSRGWDYMREKDAATVAVIRALDKYAKNEFKL